MQIVGRAPRGPVSSTDGLHAAGAELRVVGVSADHPGTVARWLLGSQGVRAGGACAA